ncbi:MAG: helix-turn-helix domain-containing protein [Gemmatimonadota bacterium]|nr:helix-turn-helix domain-containing protein [Gemmatimonadota bacterium]
MLDLMAQTLEETDTMKARETDETFGERLAEARQRCGLTQAELGKAVGASQRVIAYYEGEGGQPPGALLAHLARTLKVTSDELLGLKPATNKPSPKTARLLKRLQKIADLPPADQRTVLKLLDALHESRQRTSRPRAKARAVS